MNPTCAICGAVLIRDKDGFWMCSDICWMNHIKDTVEG